jgi:hypothetical protein
MTNICCQVRTVFLPSPRRAWSPHLFLCWCLWPVKSRTAEALIKMHRIHKAEYYIAWWGFYVRFNTFAYM